MIVTIRVDIPEVKIRKETAGRYTVKSLICSKNLPFHTPHCDDEEYTHSKDASES